MPLGEREAPRDDSTRWDHQSQTDIADHIETRYHATLRRDMPQLIDAAREVECAHAGEPAVPSGLADMLVELFGELESHMQKEERILFPWIRRATRSDAIAMPIRVMVEEHDSHREYLAQIVHLTDDFVPPPHASTTWRALYSALATLEADLLEHIHLENNILFARAVRGLS
jgi:regulator of cell morphogenesis and NO signaling